MREEKKSLRDLWIAAAVLLSTFLFSGTALASTSSTLLPISDGTYTQWTPSTGTSHFANVDDSSCNGTTDYNSTTVVGNRDSYSLDLSSIPNGATITQIDIKPCASRTATGGTNPVMNVFYRLNGADSSDSGSYSLSGTTPTDLATTTYGSLSNVKGSGTTLEIGAVLTSSTKGARLSRIASIITYTPLAAPSSLSAGSTTASTTKLTWSDNSSNETGFNVERSTDGINFTGIASTSANVTTYSDSGLTASTTYYYRVRAFNAGGYSSYSNTASTHTLDVLPVAPSNLVATATTSSAIGLTWTDNSTNETAFAVEQSTDLSTWSQIASTSAHTATGTVSYYVTGLSPLTVYYHRVRAYNSIGYSSYSNITSATTSPLTILTFDSSSNWTVPTGVSSVTIYMWGAGGGGGRGGSTGGGAGAFVTATVPVIASTSYSITIGQGGGGATPSAAGIGGTGYASGGNGVIGGTITTTAGGGGGGSSAFQYDGGTLIASGGAGGGWDNATTTACSNGGSAGINSPSVYPNQYGDGGGGGSATNGGNASSAGVGGIGGTGGTQCSGYSGIDIYGTGGGSSAGASGNGHDSTQDASGLYAHGYAAVGSGGAVGGEGFVGAGYTGSNGGAGATGSNFDSGGGGGNGIGSNTTGGNGAGPGAGGGGESNADGTGGNGGNGRVIIVW